MYMFSDQSFSRVASPSTMAACDFCPLIFHVDCLHPPMVSPPTAFWMCPNHPEQYEVCTSMKSAIIASAAAYFFTGMYDLEPENNI